MNKLLFEQLLFDEESNYLDFKSEQYLFESTNDDKKSELLKDILAFANSWSRNERYILIGVREKKGEKCEVVGITKHLDDSSLQQFVNSKTQKPLGFSYKTFAYEDKKVGILSIDSRERPFYLKKNFGKLKKETIYIRRGSSTDIASLDEISKMGDRFSSESVHSVDLQFSDTSTKTLLGTNIDLSCTLHNYDRDKIDRIGSAFVGAIRNFEDADYYLKKADYLYKTSLISPVSIWIENKGQELLSNVSVKIAIEFDPRLIVKDETDYPLAPVKSSFLRPNLGNIKFNSNLKKKRIDVHIEEGGKNKTKQWVIIGDFIDVRPKDASWSPDVFYIGARESLKIDLQALVFADNLSEPIVKNLTINVQVEKKEMDLGQLYV